MTRVNRPAALTLASALAIAGTAAFTQCAKAQGENLPIYTSPIEITGGRVTFEAAAPDRNTGAMVQLPLPAGVSSPRMSALTSTPINLLFDGQWNGTPAQQAAGTAPRQLACDGANGLRAQVMRQAAATGRTAYEISCSFATAGTVHVKQSEGALYISYQLTNNSATFRTTSGVTCSVEGGSFACPNDPKFSVTFAIEVLSLVWTPTLCGLRSEPSTVYLHAVNIDSENAAAAGAMFWDAAFGDNRFMAGELAMQAAETRGPISIDPAFAELRAACTASDPAASIVRTFSQFETEVRHPQGIIFRAIHPPIDAPRFQNVSLPYGEFTCQSGFVWRGAFEGDLACVTPDAREQAAQDNAQADARRSPTGGAYGPATCLPGYVWRGARPGDVVCVTPEVRDETAADNAAAPSRRVLPPPEFPSFARPSISAPPVVEAGAQFQVNGQFFPHASDPSKLHLAFERSTTSACFGGASELEFGRIGDQPQTKQLTQPQGSVSSCAYEHDVQELLPTTQYRFRLRDCDAVTCSPWSIPFEILTASEGGPGAVEIALDTGAALGSASTDENGAFQATVTMPAETAPGTHALHASVGDAKDTTGIQVTVAGGATATLMVTASFFGDVGCPMREYYNKIPAVETFSLFGSGFGPEPVSVFLDSQNGPALGSALPASNGTFCGYFNGPQYEFAGNHSLVAVQNGTLRATLPVEVIIVRGLH